MMDPIVLCYGKGQLTGFLADPNGVLDVVSNKHFSFGFLLTVQFNYQLSCKAKGNEEMNVIHRNIPQ